MELFNHEKLNERIYNLKKTLALNARKEDKEKAFARVLRTIMKKRMTVDEELQDLREFKKDFDLLEDQLVKIKHHISNMEDHIEENLEKVEHVNHTQENKLLEEWHQELLKRFGQAHMLMKKTGRIERHIEKEEKKLELV